jgi:hypothetical protein
MCRGWSWGNSGGVFRAKKQTRGKKCLFVDCSSSYSGNDYGEIEKEL